MKHAKTTVAGVLVIAGALITFAADWIATGHFPNAQTWSVLGGALTVGAGLISAADGKNVPIDASKPPLDVVPPVEPPKP